MSEQAEIEAVARAILKARFYDCEPGMYGSLEDFYNQVDTEHVWIARQEAAAVFSALEARGLAVVPADATAEIIDAGRLASECDPILGWAGLYAAMVRAGRVGGSR
jgi:hypothetical protein